MSSEQQSIDSRSSSVDRYNNNNNNNNRTHSQYLPAHLVSSDAELKESNFTTKASSIIEGDSAHYSSPPRSKRIPKEPLQPSSLAKSLRESMDYDGRNDTNPISSYEERNSMVSYRTRYKCLQRILLR
jgi:hypothetical protein